MPPATDPETPPVTEPETEPTPEPPPIPDGCFPITSQDLSEPHRGAGYIHNEGVSLPAALPNGSPWRVQAPAVLIVNTHPYEGYHDGTPWYDPTSGGLAQTDSPNAPDGVVALSVALTRALRDKGVTVIHLRIPTTPEESSADLYDRTEAMIRYYCRLYPDIGLILDLRRSAELTEAGEILRTEGRVNGTSTAQLRIGVSGGRDPGALSRDLAVALALREGLWAESPSLSRPVSVKNRDGLLSDASDLRVLTLEMGAAGNTYAEAVRLVPPLARSLHDILQKFG
jgi:stage II sporulation protein P